MKKMKKRILVGSLLFVLVVLLVGGVSQYAFASRMMGAGPWGGMSRGHDRGDSAFKAELLRALNPMDFTEEQWKTETECPGWTVQDNLVHITALEAMSIGKDLPLADLPDDLPLNHPQGSSGLIDLIVARLYARTDRNQFIEVTYASGAKEILHVADFVSGAMLASVVARAKQAAIKEIIAGGQRGVSAAHALAACEAEITENEDLPNTTNPDDWARISGRKGERIVFLRTLTSPRAIPSDAAGH